MSAPQWVISKLSTSGAGREEKHYLTHISKRSISAIRRTVDTSWKEQIIWTYNKCKVKLKSSIFFQFSLKSPMLIILKTLFLYVTCKLRNSDRVD